MPVREPHAFDTRLDMLDSNLWGACIVVPTAIAQVFLATGSRRVLCTLQGIETFHCALMPKGDGTWFITINKKRRDKLKLREGSPVSASLVSDESEYGLPMPEEFAAVLASDEEGNTLFHALTPGKRRNILYFVGNVNNSDTRIRRALVIVEHLKKHGGKVVFRVLNEELRGSI